MKVVEGRRDSFLTLPNDRIVSPMVFNFAVSRFKYYSDIDQYQIRQRKIDHFDVNLKLYKSLTNLEQNLLKEQFFTHLTSFLGLSGYNVTFDVSVVDEIPLSETGKLKSVWSDLKPSLG